MAEQCDNCKFVWEAGATGSEYYECRCHAPTVSHTWPKVLATDWCGEYIALVASSAEYPPDHPVKGDLGTVPA